MHVLFRLGRRYLYTALRCGAQPQSECGMQRERFLPQALAPTGEDLLGIFQAGRSVRSVRARHWKSEVMMEQ
jgi:hypothetical protein